MYGPFTKKVEIPFQDNPAWRRVYSVRDWWRMGSKARGQPLPYNYLYGYSRTSAQDAGNSEAITWCNNGRSDVDPYVSNKALAKFVSAVKDGQSASLGATLAEWEQSQKMIAARAGQLLSSLRSIKRGNVVGAARDLGHALAPSSLKGKGGRRGRAASHDASNAWLELHFGWVPLIKDIYDAVNVLQSSIPSNTVRAVSGSDLRIPIVGNDFRGLHKYSCLMKIQADVYISNPNLALANQLGLINPASVAWELVPFSFVVDWFLPVGNFLNSFTDLVGYEVKFPFTTTLRTASTHLESPYPIFQWDTEAVRCSRVLGLPSYQLRPVQFKGFSVARGATAISLLIQQFLKM